MAKKIVRRGPTKVRSPKQDRKAEIEQMVLDLHRLRTKSKDLAQDIKDKQDEILAAMDKSGMKTLTVKDDDLRLKATRQQNTTEVIDEKKLAKRIGAKMWGKVTTKSLDRKKLDAFVASGEVSIADVAACAETKESAPFIKVT